MRTETIDIYKFEELSKEAQNKAIENNRDMNVDMGNWWHFLYENYQRRFGCLFETGQMYFRGFSSQGDGAMFEYSDITNNLKKAAIKSLKNVTDFERKVLLNHLHAYGHGKQSGHYYHENSCNHYIQLEWKDQTADQSNRHGNLETLLGKVYSDIENFIESVYVKLAKNLYASLEKEYDYLTSDECIKQNLISNEYEYTEDGKIYS